MVFDRRSILAVLLAAAFAACGRGEQGQENKSPSPASRQSPAAASAPRIGEPLPSWARERPHFFDQNGRRFAAAVGRARIGNLALAQTAAQDRARADLLRLIQGKPAESRAKGTLRGARVTEIYASRNGQVYVRVEVDVDAQ